MELPAPVVPPSAMDDDDVVEVTQAEAQRVGKDGLNRCHPSINGINGDMELQAPVVPPSAMDDDDDVVEVPQQAGAHRVGKSSKANKSNNASNADGATSKGGFRGEEVKKSEQKRLESEYMTRLVNGTSKFPGIMRARDRKKKRNHPYTHQRQAVKSFVSGQASHKGYFILGHDPGLGKTATVLQAIAALCAILKRMPKIIISVPSATMDQWEDAITNWLHKVKVLSTAVSKDITRDAILHNDVILTTRDTIGNAFSSCFSKQDVTREVEGHGMRHGTEWLPTDGVKMHALFNPPKNAAAGWNGTYDMLAIDEAHMLRNADSRNCRAHNKISELCKKRILVTGTFCVNGPLDLYGLCIAGRAPRDGPIDFCDKKSWVENGSNSKTVKRDTVRALQRGHINRAREEILQLPPMQSEVVPFAVDMPLVWVSEYNAVLESARNLKMRIERSGSKATARDLQKLTSLLQLMQQFVVCPLLASHGAAKFKSETTLYQQAAQEPTGAFRALAAEIIEMRRLGHFRIVVAANHVAILKIVMLYFKREYPAFGTLFSYTGEDNRRDRSAATHDFLSCKAGILFLSIAAGGVGLHLVPGCTCMIFWGSMTFSPAHRRQCEKRIHRIGQTEPVFIKHLIPYGSVDASIGKIHGDKDALIRFVQDRDTSGFDDDEDSTWKKCGRIVDECLPVSPTDGNFPEMPMCTFAPDKKTMLDEPYSILHDIPTRGRTPEACHEYYVGNHERYAAEQAARAAEEEASRRQAAQQAQAAHQAAIMQRQMQHQQILHQQLQMQQMNAATMAQAQMQLQARAQAQSIAHAQFQAAAMAQMQAQARPQLAIPLPPPLPPPPTISTSHMSTPEIQVKVPDVRKVWAT